MSLFSQTDAIQPHGFVVFVQQNWRIVLPLVLGFLGVYLLLPRVRRSVPILGGTLAGLAVVLAGLWWTHYEGVWVEQILFYIFAGLAILGAGMMLSQHNPVHAALAFALVVLSSCGLFLLLAAPFLMAATIIIYAGAIVVTFLFVIMLAQQAGISNADIRSREPFLASMAGFIMLGTLVAVLDRGYTTSHMDVVIGKLQQLKAASTKDDVNAVLTEPSKDLNNIKPLAFVSEIRDAFPTLKQAGRENVQIVPAVLAVDQLEEAWTKQDVVAVKTQATVVLDFALAARATKGSSPAEKGSPAVLARKALPAQNVAALGRTLFTDYLIAVELAGVLLLVATIGAIVIASRRTEGLR